MKSQSAKKYRLQIVTRDRILIDQDVIYCIVPSVVGPLGVLPGHAPLMGMVNIGAVRVRDISGQEFGVFVDHGYFMISNEGVIVTVQAAEIEDHINIEQARKAMEQAAQVLRSGGALTAKEYEEAQNALLSSKTRIMVAEKRSA